MSLPRHTAGGLLALAALGLPACQQQMAVQPSVRPDSPSAFFADGRGARPLVPNTVARGHLRTDRALFTGRATRQDRAWAAPAGLLGAAAGGNVLGAVAAEGAGGAGLVEEFPFPVTRKVLEHGRNRYMIYCVVCHDPLGTGEGKIVERSYTRPPSYHIDRLRRAPAGHFFDVITNGYGAMPEHRQQIPVRDRWAIAAYVRALQLSQHFPEREMTPEMRRQWRAAP